MDLLDLPADSCSVLRRSRQEQGIFHFFLGASDSVEDPILGRLIHLQRKSRSSIVTIFEGGHESIPESAFSWLEKQQRATGTRKK